MTAPSKNYAPHNNCTRKCPGGHRCICDPNRYHTLHICADPHCACHAPTRYHPPPPKKAQKIEAQG